MTSVKIMNGVSQSSHVNDLTGDSTRLVPPVLSKQDRLRVIHLAREAQGDHIEYNDREYWADPDGHVYVVAWQKDGFVSGDPIT